MAFCLPKFYADKFLEALKSGKIVPEKLIEMTSEERRNFLSDIVGKEDAREVNTLLESKLLLLDQKRGLVSWAKKVAGMTEPARRDLIARIEKMDRVLNPKEGDPFLEDLASKKLGIDVTLEETQKISELSKKVSNLGRDLSTPSRRTAWGLAQLDLNDYAESLVPKDKNIIANVANLPKTIMSTLDFSAALRQGWGMISRPQFYKAFGAMFKYALSEGKYRELQAQIIGDPDYRIAKSSGLRISALADRLSQREEAYMSTLLDKIPGIRGSERAYIGFLNKLRFDTFKKLINDARVAGEHIGVGTKETKKIANTVNDFTGSGNIGRGDKYGNVVPLLNSTFFSPRKISATLNMLNPRRYIDPKVSKTARQAALRNIIGSTAMTAGLLSLAALLGAKVTTDSTNSDFGKFKVGKTHYDLTGGNGTYAVLVARLLENKTTSSTSGRVTQLGKGYKPETRASLIGTAARNKLSPIASYLADWLYGSDSIGKSFNATQEVIDRAHPLIISDMMDILKNDPSNLIGGFLADEFGVGVQTY